MEAVSDAWQGPRAPRLRMLPLDLGADTLPAPDGDLRVALGVEESELGTFWHDFETSPHLIVVGGTEAGKTNLLRLVSRAVVQRYSPAEARVALVDFRRELYDEVPQDSQLGYAVSVDVVRELVDGAARAMKTRVPGADITPARLRLRDWWTGPQLFVIVDDYDMLGNTVNSPFAPLLDHLAQGAEIGLHLVVARGANGAGRAMTSDPLLRRLTEVNTPVLQMSCPPSEGQIVLGTKPRKLPAGRALHITRRGVVQVQTARIAETPAQV
ncbi:FtsK/SpoIIIE domain-containing protein [Streptomyces sp. NPDC054765]